MVEGTEGGTNKGGEDDSNECRKDGCCIDESGNDEDKGGLNEEFNDGGAEEGGRGIEPDWGGERKNSQWWSTVAPLCCVEVDFGNRIWELNPTKLKK